MTKEQILNQRARIWSLTTYNGPESFMQYLSKGNIIGGVYIKHDKDEGKEPHYHILFRARNGVYLKTIVENFGTQNTFGEPARSIKSLKDYFLHKRVKDQEDGKHLYEESELIYFGEPIEISENASRAQQIIQDILDGRSVKEMLIDYGNMIIWHWDQYSHFARLIACQEAGMIVGYEDMQEYYKNREEERRHLYQLDQENKTAEQLFTEIDGGEITIRKTRNKNKYEDK